MVIFIVGYIAAVIYTNRRYKSWPPYRVVCWCVGVLLAYSAINGPIAQHAHHDFTFHMLSHLLLAMAAPLFIVLSAPMTLLLRTLSTKQARIVTKLLKSWLARIVTQPLMAATLNIGSMALLYMTDFYEQMHNHPLLYTAVHAHFFAAGYLFTMTLLYIDPVYHRHSFWHRAVVLLLAMAAHSTIAKYMYAHPPTAVAVEQAQIGSMLMYYGGGIVDAALVFILCWQWYRAVKPRKLAAI